MHYTQILFGSPEYDASLRLRYRVLREPLHLEYTIEQIEAEYDSIHLAAFDDQEKMVATLVLHQIRPEPVFKMRQVCVEPDLQAKGIGTALVEFAEKKAKLLGCERITLHARDVSVPFYEKLGYQKLGDPFIEVGIQHHEMEKSLISMI